MPRWSIILTFSTDSQQTLLVTSMGRKSTYQIGAPATAVVTGSFLSGVHHPPRLLTSHCAHTLSRRHDEPFTDGHTGAP